MSVRLIKIILVLIISLQALVYATQNMVNLDAAYATVAYVISNKDHAAYPNSFTPAITNPILIWIAVATIIAVEYAAGLMAAKGTLDLWQKRKASADEFNAAKTNALWGAGLTVVVWLGLFGVIANGVFQMWQTEIGVGSSSDAFKFFVSGGLVLIFVNMTDT